MNQFFRLFWLLVFRKAKPIGLFDVCSTPFTVVPADLDVLMHMNNGVYSSLMDLGRVDMMQRAGLLKKLNQQGWYPVMTLATIQFRKSLGLWQRFQIETQFVGMDAKSTYVQQQFIRRGQVVCSAVMGARFLKKSGGTCSPQELLDLAGYTGPVPELPTWLVQLTTSLEELRQAEKNG